MLVYPPGSQALTSEEARDSLPWINGEEGKGGGGREEETIFDKWL